ncbi:MAG TPA: hypothetical protein VFB06_27620 [Streptosporangiaceae bacterium]|nr:hypothetical protein [Streptosporangiaceae bacterium]
MRAGSVGSLAPVTGGAAYDAVLLLGVLMYLPASEPVIAELAAHVAPGGPRCVRGARPRPGRGTGHALPERDRRVGPCDSLDALTSAAAARGLELENWYGVRIAVDAAELDPPPPSDPRELAALLDVEERLGASDPYRQLGQLAHLILRRRSSDALGLRAAGYAGDSS